MSIHFGALFRVDLFGAFEGKSEIHWFPDAVDAWSSSLEDVEVAQVGGSS